MIRELKNIQKLDIWKFLSVLIFLSLREALKKMCIFYDILQIRLLTPPPPPIYDKTNYDKLLGPKWPAPPIKFMTKFLWSRISSKYYSYFGKVPKKYFCFYGYEWTHSSQDYLVYQDYSSCSIINLLLFSCLLWLNWL